MGKGAGPVGWWLYRKIHARCLADQQREAEHHEQQINRAMDVCERRIQSYWGSLQDAQLAREYFALQVATGGVESLFGRPVEVTVRWPDEEVQRAYQQWAERELDKANKKNGRWKHWKGY